MQNVSIDDLEALRKENDMKSQEKRLCGKKM